MAQVWKSLLCCREPFSMLKSIIIKCWLTEIVPDEWNIGRLIFLFKKEDLSLPKDYRGTMLFEIASKIIAIIHHARLLPTEESLDLESKCGFRSERGCTDVRIYDQNSFKKEKRAWFRVISSLSRFG